MEKKREKKDTYATASVPRNSFNGEACCRAKSALKSFSLKMERGNLLATSSSLLVKYDTRVHKKSNSRVWQRVDVPIQRPQLCYTKK